MHTSRPVTRCPHCSTRFHISTEQLQAAAGAVRCGACMQVFNAELFLEHSEQPNVPLVSVTPEQPAPATHQAASPVPATDELAGAPDEELPLELDLDSDDFTAELARLARLEAEERAAGISRHQQLAGRIMPSYQSEPRPAPDTGHPPPDEPVTTAEPAISPYLVTTDSVEEEEALDSQHVEPALGESENKSLELPPISALDEQEPEPELADDELEAAPDSAADAELAAEDEDGDDWQDESNDFRIDPFNLIADRSDSDLADSLSTLDDEPLQLDWQSAPPSGPRIGKLWTLLSVLALCGLLVQYLNYNFDHLARQDSTRPWLESLCNLLPCQLPGKSDISQVKSTNLVVRQHPEFRDALVVDAILYNRAPFSQPFPLLELNFLDEQDSPVASRAFHPREYLAGELAGQREMPSQIPIHIALEVLAPDARATRYGIRFLAH